LQLDAIFAQALPARPAGFAIEAYLALEMRNH